MTDCCKGEEYRRLPLLLRLAYVWPETPWGIRRKEAYYPRESEERQRRITYEYDGLRKRRTEQSTA